MSQQAMIPLDAEGNTLTGDAVANWVWMKDPATGLEWGRTLANHPLEAEATTQAAALGARLPTIAELETLVDRSKFKPAIREELASDTAIDQPYRATDPGADGGEDVCWLVDFTFGTTGIGIRTFPMNVRPVKASA